MMLGAHALGRHAVAPGAAAQPLVALLGSDAVGLLSLKTRQSVGSLRGSRGATCAAFSADGLLLHTAGEALRMGASGWAALGWRTKSALLKVCCLLRAAGRFWCEAVQSLI